MRCIPAHKRMCRAFLARGSIVQPRPMRGDDAAPDDGSAGLRTPLAGIADNLTSKENLS